MKKIIFTIVLAFLFGMQVMNAAVKADIEKTTKAGNSIFLVVTEPGNGETAKALSLANGAQKIYSKSTVIQMNRADKANDELVTKYQLEGASLPIILVIASNGAVAGGTLLADATSEKIAAMIPTAKKADVLKAMQDGKAVFLVVSKKSHQKKDVLSKCKDACSDMKEKAEITEIDFNDASEKKFLNELKISEVGNEPKTYVLNASGQITGSFTGVTDSKILVATATKKASGCCPPGSKKSCGPTK